MSRLVMSRNARQVPGFLLVSSHRTVGKYLIAYGASGQRATVQVKGYRSRISASSSGINTGLTPVTTENGAVLSHSATQSIAPSGPKAGGRSPLGDGAGGREHKALAVYGPRRLMACSEPPVKCRLGGDRQLEQGGQDVASNRS